LSPSGDSEEPAVANNSDYCPIAVGVDILGDRWTPLVIRELMVGSSGFNEIHRGIPRISRTLLAQRLRTLERRGLVSRDASTRGRAGHYRLTPAGESLTPVVWALGHWAAEWVFGDPSDEDCDGQSLLWRMHQLALPAMLPAAGRTVVRVLLTGPGRAEGWLVVERGGITVCTTDPGYDVGLTVEADTARMHSWLRGRVAFTSLLAAGEVTLTGPRRLARAFPTWFDTDLFAEGFRRGEERRRRELSA
jgi:DNA-binding HxlR family transcriptional regulator